MDKRVNGDETNANYVYTILPDCRKDINAKSSSIQQMDFTSVKENEKRLIGEQINIIYLLRQSSEDKNKNKSASLVENGAVGEKETGQ